MSDRWSDGDEDRRNSAIADAMQQLRCMFPLDNDWPSIKQSLRPVLRELFEAGFGAGVRYVARNYQVTKFGSSPERHP